MRRASSPRPVRPIVLALTVTALLVAGCAGPKEQTTLSPTPSPTGSSDVDPSLGLDAFYGQTLTWQECGSGTECTTVKAPLDWDDPTAGAIDLAVKRRPASGDADERIGSLLLNPGGPGASGVEFLDSAVGFVLGDDVLDAYDVVGFDPRGVGASTPVDCGDDATVDAFIITDYPMESQADVEAARERTRAFGEACLAATGPLLGEVDTVSAARDMDLLRAVLGDEKLHYLGFSYGTFLGATYADLYPANVGHLVLDGALDPSMSNDDLLIGQAIGFENALRAYVTDCQESRDCPLRGTLEDGLAQVADVVDKAEASPLPTSTGAEVNGTLAWYGIVVTLYDDGSWPYLTMALEEALEMGTGDILLQLANFYLDRTPDGRYENNSNIAFQAINCLDYPTPVRDYVDLLEFAEQVEAVAPTFGREFAMGVGCETWPFQATVERKPVTASGAGPILVVGTTGDPATPYEWSVALAEQLESAELLTWQGEGHTAYGRGGECVADVVETYLLEGTLPAGGATC